MMILAWKFRSRGLEWLTKVFNLCTLLFSYLVVWRKLHGRDAVDVFFDLGEQVIPAADNPALVLVIHQIKLIGLPKITNLQKYGNDRQWATVRLKLPITTSTSEVDFDTTTIHCTWFIGVEHLWPFTADLAWVWKVTARLWHGLDTARHGLCHKFFTVIWKLLLYKWPITVTTARQILPASRILQEPFLLAQQEWYLWQWLHSSANQCPTLVPGWGQSVPNWHGVSSSGPSSVFPWELQISALQLTHWPVKWEENGVI